MERLGGRVGEQKIITCLYYSNIVSVLTWKIRWSFTLDSRLSGPDIGMCCVLGLDTFTVYYMYLYTSASLISAQVYLWVPTNSWVKLRECWGEAFDELASHPGGSTNHTAKPKLRVHVSTSNIQL